MGSPQETPPPVTPTTQQLNSANRMAPGGSRTRTVQCPWRTKSNSLPNRDRAVSHRQHKAKNLYEIKSCDQTGYRVCSSWRRRRWKRGSTTAALVMWLFIVCIFCQIEVGSGSCQGGGRTVLTSQTGVLSDGRGNYPQDTECQWLIQASNSSQSICVQFKSFETECTYDFLHLFDGDAFSSPRLGSFSGSKIPPKLCANSGKMLIYLYSDTNYPLDGFELNYTISDCPLACGGRGSCMGHRCQCSSGYYGDSCQYRNCPNECGTHGRCNHDMMQSRCDCEPGYIGESCSLATDTKDGGGNMFLLAGGGDPVFSPRTGHAAVYHAESDAMFIFGGYNLISELDDLLKYNFQSNTWEIVPATGGPAGRYAHTMDLSHGSLLIVGGILTDGSFSDELWSFNIALQRWSQLPSLPSGLGHHSSCTVNDTFLYIIGGRNDASSFHHKIYRYDLTARSGWVLVEPAGGIPDAIGVAEHSSVYHPPTGSIYVFGGIRQQNIKFGRRSNVTYTFNVEKRLWLQLTVTGDLPRGRTYHTAAIIGQHYMVVYGGNTHTHKQTSSGPLANGNEECYEDSIHLYHFGCNAWVDYDSIANDFTVDRVKSLDRGRFGHSAVVRDDSTLVIAGGFRGLVTNDVIAIKMPGTVAVNPAIVSRNTTGTEDYCAYHTGAEVCLKDLECGFCQASSRCVSKAHAQDCPSMQYGSCPGFCDQASTCHACLSLDDSSDVRSRCGWCVQTRTCHTHPDIEAECSPLSGWWGDTPTIVKDFGRCVLEDFPPGLTLVRYYRPDRSDHPDEVEVIGTMRQELNQQSPLGKVVEHRWTLEGFLYPLNAIPSKGGSHLEVYLRSTNAETELWMSANDSVDAAVRVVYIPSTSGDIIEADRADSAPLIPDPSSRYYVRLDATVHAEQKPSILELSWNGDAVDLEIIPWNHLRPFASGDCGIYSNCYACLKDALCGWCPLSRTCELRNSTTLPSERCGSVGVGLVGHYLTLNQEYCPHCRSHLDCITCVQSPHCEWVEETKEHCTWRGSSQDSAVTEVGWCSHSCYQRTACGDCVREEGCAWCESDGRCFPFRHYVKTYSYGQCSHWFDKDNPCPNCSAHKDCHQCLGEFQCGWCGNREIPLYGVCTQGDFSGPISNHNCSSLVAQSSADVSPSEPADWSYHECPESDECAKGLAGCHPDATCYDTYFSYECKCNRGFKGDGNITCDRTCLHDCVHGVCTESPDYECLCDLGWTGPNCTTDCGCNMHSTCAQGVRMCDQCQLLTVGDQCDQCQPGSFGDPLSGEGCHPCNCNGHGDPSRGYCDSDSERCHCIGNTAGDHCERCAAGFYGDPETRGCFLECSGRSIRWGERRIALGSLIGDGVEDPLRAGCLWILSPFQSEEFAASTSVGGTIQLTITSINTTCGRDYVQVYDGVPEDVWGQPNASSELLGNFCGHGEMEPLTVTAHSGFVSVIFQAVLKGQYRWTGFTALYEFISCGEVGGCGENRTCVDGACVCDSSHRGERCDQDACPENCHEGSGQGTCNQVTGVCHCSPGYGGGSCGHQTAAVTRGVWTRLEGDLAPPGRVGHSMFRRSDDQLVIFGGFSDDARFLNDMWRYDPTDGSWHEVLYANRGPSGRYFHGTVFLPSKRELFIYGGLTEEGATQELWIYNTSSRLWHQKPADGRQHPPPLAGLTLTAHHGFKFLLVGGYSPQEAFYPTMKEYNADLGQWSTRVPKGIGPIGIYGHASVWHRESGALYVFGGYRFARGHVWSSDVLYSYRLSSNNWNILAPASNFAPSSHLFHAGFTTSRYLFIFGGGTPEQNFTSSIHAYQYDCKTWQEVKTTNDGPLHAFGQTVVDVGGVSYVYGGFIGSSIGSLYSLVLPDDLCRQYQSQEECKRVPSCTGCSVNNTFLSCTYRNSCSPNVESPPYVTDSVNGSIVECNTTSVPVKSCRDHKTCGECVATYPAHSSNKFATKMGCKWCKGCPEVTCIPRTESCQQLTCTSRLESCQKNCLNNQFEEITDIHRCSELVCPVSDCEDCLTMPGCLWTRQFQLIEDSESRYRLASYPAYSWNCYTNQLLSVRPVGMVTETAPPMSCPSHCHTHTTCGDCLESDGADGGWSACVWSTNFQQCMSPSFLYLRCTTGRCGLIIYDNSSSDLCPVPCSTITRCDSCLKQANCGWCSVGANHTSGVCMEGSKASPTNGICQDRTITGKMFITAPLIELAEERTEWFYMTCPPENECTNGDHNCGENEQCVDTQESYTCECKEGYIRDGDECVPICSRECLHGTCVAPDTCGCNFGYVGEDCTLQCACNNHSSCAGPEDLGHCPDCVGNTMGLHCELCETFYVGNASGGGQCRPCSSVCQGNTDICVSHKDFTSGGVSSWEGRPGPLADDVICLNCSNNSNGALCEDCQDGFFMLSGRCQPCQCNGHSDTCNKLTGTECHCSNHTTSPPCPEGNRIAPCHEHQCSVCTEPDVYKGTPTNGHQCYRQVDVTSTRCFGESTNMKCSSGSPLPPGRSELFVVKPTFVDLDIRITVDVSEGSLDVYISHEPDTFVIESYQGGHTVLIDVNKDVDRTDVIPVDGSRRRRREAGESIPAEDAANRVISLEASGLNTFVTVDDSHFVMVIRNVQNRMVVTFPHIIHNFEKKWFYLILHAREGPRNDTPGALIYKQDIPEIDLFIFFSAFLSSFFKLLAILIAIWKLKVSWEARQAQRARSVEMENRRSRPFGRVVVYMEEIADPLPPLPVHPSRRTKRKSPKHRKERSTTAPRDHQSPVPPTSAVPPGVPTPPASQPAAAAEATEEKLQFSPGWIAMEHTEDGLAAVGTVVIALPGGKKAPLLACLGSGLVRQGKCNAVPPNQTRMARHVGGTKQGTRQSSGRTYRPV